MKKEYLAAAILILLAMLTLPAFGQSRVVDNAGLLSSSEKTELESRIAELARTYDFDLVIVTEQSIGNKDPMDYADDFFDYNGYGLGGDRDGLLFLRVQNTRDYWFSSSGRGEKILNDAAFDKLESDVVPYLRSDSYYKAFSAFLDTSGQFLVLDAKGRTYNIFHRYFIQIVAGAWVLAFLIGFLIVNGWKRQMNTALAKTEANAYIKPGSLSFSVKQDSFLYSRVTKTAKPKSSPGGGGSHTSSSGRSHGGRGGRA